MSDDLNSILSRLIVEWEEERDELKEYLNEKEFENIGRFFAFIEELGQKYCEWNK